MNIEIDVNYNFQAEANGRSQKEPNPPKLLISEHGNDWNRSEKDSDRWSKTLQEYHVYLWSKPLPNGQLFLLSKASQNRLYHKSEMGEFHLSSDRATTVTFAKNRSALKLASKLPQNLLNEFSALSDTIGGMILWPAKQRNRLNTINQARGFGKTGHLIADRLDLTIECVRKFYTKESSSNPLHDVFTRYSDFFELFQDFKGFIDFFLLQDMVSSCYTKVKFAKPFNDFNAPPIPQSLLEYEGYIEHTSNLVKARNIRIAQWAATNFKQDD